MLLSLKQAGMIGFQCRIHIVLVVLTFRKLSAILQSEIPSIFLDGRDPAACEVQITGGAKFKYQLGNKVKN